jgi:hypothetical protein
MEGLKVELKNTALQTTLEAIYMNHYTSAEGRNAARAFLKEGRARQLLPRGKGSCGIRDERKGSRDCSCRWRDRIVFPLDLKFLGYRYSRTKRSEMDYYMGPGG